MYGATTGILSHELLYQRDLVNSFFSVDMDFLYILSLFVFFPWVVCDLVFISFAL